MPALMLGLVAIGRLRRVVVDQLETQFDHLQPELAVLLRPIVAGRGQMLKERVDDRIEGEPVVGVQFRGFRFRHRFPLRLEWDQGR
jgi:hypothetical protein